MARYRIVQLSDLHLRSDDALLPGISPARNLAAALRAIEEQTAALDIVILSGDLADAGERACYVDLKARLDELGRQTGAEIVYCPGNHDDRAAFCEVLLGRRAAGPIFETRIVGGLRVISVDSNLPGRDDGRLGRAALEYLRVQLRRPAPDGTIVVVHHPPTPSPIEPMSELGLKNPDELSAAIRGSDVRLILSGHNHHALASALDGVQVWVSPATSYLSNAARRDRFEKLPHAAFSLIELDETGQSTCVIPLPVAPIG